MRLSPDSSYCSITLDCTTRSLLRWDQEIELAQEAVSSGKTILWNFQMGLFYGLEQPLNDESQYRALALSLNHFSQKIWSVFSINTLGAILYQGPLYTMREAIGFSETDSAYVRQQEMLTYLELLSRNLPAELPLLLLLQPDREEEKTLETLAFLNKESYPYFIRALPTDHPLTDHLIIDGGAILSEGKVTDHSPRTGSQATLGLCYPKGNSPEELLAFEREFNKLNHQITPFKVVYEGVLAASWDGLETLLLPSRDPFSPTSRMALGFAAAGGTFASY